MHDVEENTQTKPHETWELRMIKPKQILSFDELLIVPEKRLLGVTILQVYNSVSKITGRIINFVQYIPGYYGQKPVDFESLQNI